MQTETFFGLLRSAGHWEFELFLMILFDVILGGIFYPFVRKHWQHHVNRDIRNRLEQTPSLHGPWTRIVQPREFTPEVIAAMQSRLDKQHASAYSKEFSHPEKKPLDNRGPRC